MPKPSPTMIDMFPHILPVRYREALYKKSRDCFYIETNDAQPALSNLDIRFRVMDQFEGLVEVLNIVSPPIEYVVGPDDAVELAKMANDEMAELVAKYPDRFVAAVACLPMSNIDAALMETDRAIKELNFKGVQVYTSVNGKPLDSPEFMELYRKMEQYDLPVWIHPARDWDIPDYPGETQSKYNLFIMMGWPYETSLAMARLAHSGVLEKFPNLKFITHHCGGMVPFFARRFALRPAGVDLKSPPVEYMRKFYADTVLQGNTPALMCGHAFFGSEHMLFGTDYPFGGADMIRNTIDSIETR